MATQLSVAVRHLPWLATLSFVAADAAAQCAPSFAPGSIPGTNGPVRAVAEWDPDGAGPMAPQLVIGGRFTAAGDTAATNVAMRDPVSGQWSALGGGLPGLGVYGLTVDGTGQLVAVGYGATTLPSAYRWTGTAWQSFGTVGPNNERLATVTRLQNGDLVVGGRFTSIGGVAADNVARWDGASWHPLGSGISGRNDHVSRLLVLQNGDLIATGYVTVAGGAPAQAVARWNGSAWSSVGSPPLPYSSGGMVQLVNGDLVVGFGGAFGLQRYDGVSWNPEGPAPNLQAVAMTLAPSGDLIVAGTPIFFGGVDVGSVGVWNGSSWSELGDSPDGDVTALAQTAVGLVAVGEYFPAAMAQRSNVATWNGAAWTSLGGGVDEIVAASLETSDGALVLAGSFRSVDGTPTGPVARIDSAGVHGIGLGLTGFVQGVDELPNGDLVACGAISIVGGQQFVGVARWDGNVWSAVGGGSPVGGSAIAVLPNGDLVAGGSGGSLAARWDGSAWIPMPGLDVGPWCMAVLRDGTLVSGGLIGGGVARWDGSTWVAMGPFASSTRSLTPLPGGGLLAGAIADGVFHWDGSTWTALGTAQEVGSVALGALPDGSFVGVAFDVVSQGLALVRYDGAGWQPFAGAFEGSSSILASVPTIDTLTVRTSGEVVVGGRFLTVDGQPSANLARLSPPCPADVQVVGIGCVGSGGQNVLASVTSPWLGAPFVSEATGMPATGVAIAAFGLTGAAVSLPTVTPLALPGCDLLVSPDVVSTLLPTAGTVEVAVAMPAGPSLVGQMLHEQVVAIGLSPTLQITEITSSNALVATIGSY